jgi:hypothetical protein
MVCGINIIRVNMIKFENNIYWLIQGAVYAA